jgi:hypothetical protein
MNDPTHDELLADAVGYVALGVLPRLTRDADGSHAFLEGFLRVAATHGAVAESPRSLRGSARRLHSADTDARNEQACRRRFRKSRT